MLNNEERPGCILCNSNYSLKHVLIDCVDVVDVRHIFIMSTIYMMYLQMSQGTQFYIFERN